MRPVPSFTLISILLLSLPLYSAAAVAAGSGAIQDRLDRVERTLAGKNKVLMDLLERVDVLQHEIRELRGQVEVQSHALSKLERGGYMGAAPESGTAPAGEAPGISSRKVPPVSKAADAASPRSPARKTPQPASAAHRAKKTPSNNHGARKATYRKAFSLLKEGAYKKAITALESFLEQYPRGQYADSAQYWLGEAYYVTEQYRRALVEFQKFTRRYPSNSNLADALLKAGYAQHELGQKTKAKRTLGDLIKRYPDTAAARLAKKRLREIRTGK